ncbi:MAG: GNAT family N-acetyltransferase [Brevinematia bacterium]
MELERKRIIFSKDYILHSVVQYKQNKNFVKYIYQKLKDFDFIPTVVAEFGVGDGTLATKLFNSFKPKTFYIVDLSKDFLKNVEKNIPQAITINKDFLEIDTFDFKQAPEIVVSSNSLHWLPLTPQKNEWVRAIEKIYEILSEGGFLFVHCGLKWTYFALYDLANELFEKSYKRRVDLSEYLYYPPAKEIIQNFEKIGFRIIHYKDFYEIENFTASYTKEELYKSFSVSGLNVFLAEIQDLKEKEVFKESFLKACYFYEPITFSHRGFFSLRKPYSANVDFTYKLISPGSASNREKELIAEFLSKVSDDFYPPLTTRSPDDNKFSCNIDSSIYITSLLRDYWILFAQFGDKPNEIAALLAFTVKTPFSIPSTSKCIYISTLAVARKYRNAGIGTRLYKYFLEEIFPKHFKHQGISNIETRTWSTNIASKRLLENLGFIKTKEILHHRGEGIHTEYYTKQMS